MATYIEYTTSDMESLFHILIFLICYFIAPVCLRTFDKAFSRTGEDAAPQFPRGRRS